MVLQSRYQFLSACIVGIIPMLYSVLILRLLLGGLGTTWLLTFSFPLFAYSCVVIYLSLSASFFKKWLVD